ncbi:acyltransferase [Rubripirellula sp.]|nr:acyltransferase [Rubripirellula sp.]MDB4621381.1 acyltransferase [Rubripirellula sp.]
MLKQLIKSTLRGLAVLAISPLILSHWLSSTVSDADRSLESHSQLLSLFPGITGNYLRLAFYRFALEQCDPTATICFGTLFSKTGARLGKHVYIGPRCMLGLVTLEDDVLLGPAVQIPSGPMTHGIERLDRPIRLQQGKQQMIRVGTDSWIGANSVVLADISEQTIVAAGSVVTKKLPEKIIAAGVPAIQKKRRLDYTTPRNTDNFRNNQKITGNENIEDRTNAT